MHSVLLEPKPRAGLLPPRHALSPEFPTDGIEAQLIPTEMLGEVATGHRTIIVAELQGDGSAILDFTAHRRTSDQIDVADTNEPTGETCSPDNLALLSSEGSDHLRVIDLRGVPCAELRREASRVLHDCSMVIGMHPDQVAYITSKMPLIDLLCIA